MDGTVYVYPQYRSPVTLLGHGTCLEPSTRCATTGRSVCHIPFGAWKLDSARYSFDKHCLSTFCPPSIHRLSSAADAFHRSAAAAAAVAAAAVNGSGGGTTGGGGASSSSTNNNGSTNAGGSTIGTGPGSGGTDTANACYSLHNSTAASVAAAVSSFIPTMSSHGGAHAGPHAHSSAGATPSLIQAAAAAAAAARQQPYLTDAKHAALTFTSPLSGTQKLLPSAEAFPTMLPVFSDSLSQLNYGRKVFPCPQCRYTTDRRNNLKRHMLTMHQACSKLLECCGILFTTKASLREHALIFHYHGYTCYYCGRRFCRKALLKRHLSVHNGQKDFVCSVCDYATSHKSNLERHRKVHVRQDSDGKVTPAGIICVDGSSSSNIHNTNNNSNSSSGSNSHHSHPHSHKKNRSHGASSSTPSGGHCTKTSHHSDDDDDEDELLCVDSQHVDGRPLHLHRSHSNMKHEVNDSDDDVSICLDDEEVHVN